MLSVHLNALTDHKTYKIEQYITQISDCMLSDNLEKNKFKCDIISFKEEIKYNQSLVIVTIFLGHGKLS